MTNLMNDELEGWKLEDDGYSTTWSKNIKSSCTGFPFRIIRINTPDMVKLYSLGMHEYPHWFATRGSLVECQRLAHETARLWAVERNEN